MFHSISASEEVSVTVNGSWLHLFKALNPHMLTYYKSLSKLCQLNVKRENYDDVQSIKRGTEDTSSHSCTLGVVGGGVQRHGRAPLSGVVEAVLPARGRGVGAVATQDHGAAQETESGADPAGVQREAERHQTLVLVSADGKPDSRDDTTQSWKRREERGVKEDILKDKR